MAARRNTEVRLYDSLPVTNTTKFRTLLRKQVYSAKGRMTRKSGYADAEIVLNGKRSAYRGLVQGRCMEVYARDRSGQMQRLYRGYIVNIAGDKKGGRSREAAQTVVSLLGVWDQRSRTVIRQRYAFPDGSDLGSVFKRITAKWLQRKYPYLVIDGGNVGQSLFALDGWRRTFGSIAEDIVDASGGYAVCGADVDPVTGADRLYMRSFDDPASAMTIILPDPRNRVSRYEAEEDATGIANVIDLKGGKRRFPNLLAQVTQGNTSFEYPTRISEDTFGELIFDGGFEGDNVPPGTPVSQNTLTGITVISNQYGGSQIVADRANAFTRQDAGRQVTITGGNNFTVGTYKITGVFFAERYGWRRWIAQLDKRIAPVGSSTGTGIVSAVDAWNLTGAAAIRLTGGQWGAADSGNYFIQLANQGDSVFKPFGPDSTIQEGETFRFRTRLRLENGGGAGNRALLLVRWYNSSNAQVGPDVAQGFALNTADGYDTYTLDTNCPVGAVRGRCYVMFETKPSGATGGIMVDNLSMTSASDVVQPGWEFFPTGTAKVVESDWAYEGVLADSAVHGAYSVRLKGTSSDADNNDISFRPRDEPKIGVTTGQTVVFKIWVKNPAHQVAAGIARPKIQMQMLLWNENGTYNSVVKADYPATTSADWMQLVVVKQNIGVRSVTVSAAVRGSGEVLFDAAELLDGGAGIAAATSATGYPFAEADTYEQVIKATDTFDAASDEYKSAATWGEIVDLVDEDTITVAEDASRYGTVRLSRTTVPNQRPQIEVVGAAMPFFPGKYLRAVGRDAAEVLPSALPILEVEWEITARGVLKMRPSLNTEEVSEERVIRDITRRELAKGGGSTGTGSYSGSASSLTLGGGGTTTPPSNVVLTSDPRLNPYRLIARYTTATAPSGTLVLDYSGRIECQCSTGNITLVLPDPNTITSLDGLALTIIKEDGATLLPGTTVTIRCAGTGTVGKLAVITLTEDQDMVMLIVSSAQNNYLNGRFSS